MDSLLFLLGALALGLAGQERRNHVKGTNQSWNHAGNVVAAVVAMGMVAALSLTSIFYSVGAFSLLAASSVLLIRESDLKKAGSWSDLLTDP